jgi:metal-dependent hydrolase (beta-lactamase superfamily II)
LKEATDAFRALCEYGGYLTEEQRVKAVVAGLGLTHLTNEQRNKLIDQIKPADVEEAPAIEEKK